MECCIFSFGSQTIADAQHVVSLFAIVMWFGRFITSLSRAPMCQALCRAQAHKNIVILLLKSGISWFYHLFYLLV